MVLLVSQNMIPNTALEPTPITPVRFRCGFPVGGSPRPVAAERSQDGRQLVAAQFQTKTDGSAFVR